VVAGAEVEVGAGVLGAVVEVGLDGAAGWSRV
jgi:hypothetical protein